MLGYLGNTNWLKRYGHWFKISPAQITWLEEAIRTHTVKVLFVAKLTLSLALPALIATGMAGWPGGAGLALFFWQNVFGPGVWYWADTT